MIGNSIRSDSGGPISVGRWSGVAAGWLVLASLILWAEWPAFVAMTNRWFGDPRYSHGMLVPLVSAFLLWRRGVVFGTSRGATFAAISLFLLGGLVKILGAAIFLSWLDDCSLLIWVVGLCLLMGGWPLLQRAWPSVAFLVFMIPLPYRVEVAIGAPMQRLATEASTYLLQTFGMPATSQGNLIALDEKKTIAVVEACNGLGMLFTFACYTTAAAMLLRRPILDRVILLASAAPLALGANILRITSTGVMYRLCDDHTANVFFHDASGWLMMPIALLMLWGESALLKALFIDAGVEGLPPSGREVAGLLAIGTNGSRSVLSADIRGTSR